jgi:hypothetical protein
MHNVSGKSKKDPWPSPEAGCQAGRMHLMVILACEFFPGKKFAGDKAVPV